jgi:hypothetical protein
MPTTVWADRQRPPNSVAQVFQAETKKLQRHPDGLVKLIAARCCLQAFAIADEERFADPLLELPDTFTDRHLRHAIQPRIR